MTDKTIEQCHDELPISPWTGAEIIPAIAVLGSPPTLDNGAGTAADLAAYTLGLATLAGLIDVDTDGSPSPVDGQTLTYHAATQKWVAATPVARLSALSDTDIAGSPSPTNGQTLTYNASTGKWIASTPVSGSTSLAALTDTDVAGSPSPADGQALTWNQLAAKWVAATPTMTVTLTGDVTGSGSGSFATTIASSVALAGNPTTTTQAAGDASTKLATTQFVQTAVLQSPAKEAVKYATTAALPSVVYANGSSGVGATLTGVALAAISTDSSSPAVNDRLMVKNQASTFQNGLYTVTATGSGVAVFVLTRTADFDQATDIKTGDSVLVTAGSTLAGTTWNTNSADAPVMGTDAITFAQTAGPGSITSGNGITVTGASVAIDTSVTVDKTTAQTLTNKTLTSPTLTTPALGTPSALVLTSATGLPTAGLVASAVTNAKLANMANATIKGRTTAGTGDPEDLTATQAAAILQGDGLTNGQVGFRNIPQNSQSAAYTTVAADSGKHILHPSGDANARTFTIDSNANVAYPVGTTITFVNQTSQVVSIAITSDTLTLANSTTSGTRLLAQNGVATALKITSTIWIISGSGLT